MTAAAAKKQSSRKTRPKKSPVPTAAAEAPAVPGGSVLSPEAEVVLNVVDALAGDLEGANEPSTALLLYALLQTPHVTAHNLLGTLPPDVRARIAVQSWSEAQIPLNGISVAHIRYAAKRVASEVCLESKVDSRHLLMTCLVGSGLLGGGPELGIPNTESRFILGRSNSAVRALADSGVDPLNFLETVRKNPSKRAFTQFPSFFVFLPQEDRTRVLRIEEVGEFLHQPSGWNMRYPATLGLLDRSLTRPLPGLLEFEALLNDYRTPEREFQKFFQDHVEFLMSDEHVSVRPGVLLSGSEDFGLKPDFFLQRRDTPLWDLAELKLPTARLVQGIPARRGLAGAVRHAMDQMRTYREFFLDTKLAASFRKQHGLEIYHPRLTLIIGRDAAFGDYHERQRLSPPEVRLLTYDDLLRMAKHRALVLPFATKRLPDSR